MNVFSFESSQKFEILLHLLIDPQMRSLKFPSFTKCSSQTLVL
jgi:hypothetical protein